MFLSNVFAGESSSSRIGDGVSDGSNVGSLMISLVRSNIGSLTPLKSFEPFATPKGRRSNTYAIF